MELELAIIYIVLPAIVLVYGLVAVLAGRRLSSIVSALTGTVLCAGLAFLCAAWVNSWMSPMGRDLTRFIKAYLLLFCVPGVSVTATALGVRGLRSSLWARASMVVLVFLVAFVAGAVLSARLVDFVNASG